MNCSGDCPRPTSTSTSTVRSGPRRCSNFRASRACGCPPTTSRACGHRHQGGDLKRTSRSFRTLSVLGTVAALERTAYELASDAAAENVRYLEVRFSPILHQEHGLSLETIVEAVLSGLERARREHGVRSGVILCGLRHIGPDVSLRLADLAIAYRHKGVVAFDLAGAEKDYPAKEHSEAFARIRKHNINVTVHAGESVGPPARHQALHRCGAHRIGHRTRLREDPDLLA